MDRNIDRLISLTEGLKTKADKMRVLERAGYSSSLVSIPYYFVLINVAAAQALVKFAAGQKQAVWTPRLG